MLANLWKALDGKKLIIAAIGLLGGVLWEDAGLASGVTLLADHVFGALAAIALLHKAVKAGKI